MTWSRSAVAASRYPVSSNVRSWCAAGETTSAMNWRSPSSISLSAAMFGNSEFENPEPSDRQLGAYMDRKINVRNPCRFPAHALRIGNLRVSRSGYLIHHDLVGNAAQRRLLLNGRDRFLVQDIG